MSRRRGEFEHRTSIFEGAFRAWSHLGGLDPTSLETKPASELDPLNFPIENDPRLESQKGKKSRASGNKAGADGAPEVERRDFPYEPLPRSGLAHPFVQAILSPWLGPDADQDAIQLGLTTLRTWWQHRRKGESGSAIVALGTEKMNGVVEGYTRHFFNLAHCLIVNDKEQPPRTLHGKMRDIEKTRSKKGKKRTREDESIKAAAMAFESGFAGQGGGGGMGQAPQLQQPQGNEAMMLQQMGGMLQQQGGMNGMSPLDRLQEAQRRQLAEAGGVHTTHMGGGGMPQDPAAASASAQPSIEVRGRCMPGKVDLPGLVQQVSSAATQLAHRGISASSSGGLAKVTSSLNNVDPSKYGDPNVTPVVIVSPNQTTGTNDVQFCMTIDGITCAHCVKIVETVLRGCHGSRSPIDGLLDAAADMEMNIVLIKIDSIGSARRIAHEAARNLSMVGYTANAKSLNVPADMTLMEVYKVMESTIPSLSPMMGFMWGYECGCPDNNVLRQDCTRHSQMGQGIMDVLAKTEQLANDFVAGCTKRTGLPCTAGVHCYCQSGVAAAAAAAPEQQQLQSDPMYNQDMAAAAAAAQQADNNGYMSYQQPIQDSAPSGPEGEAAANGNAGMPQRRTGRSSMRMSIGGLGGLGRHLSMTSETTFGRAMSGLSALSIDWENMDDFDINVDHSAGINNDIINGQQQQQAQNGQPEGGQQSSSPNPAEDGGQQEQLPQDNGGVAHMGGGGPRVARRSSLRKNIPPMGSAAYNVSFNM